MHPRTGSPTDCALNRKTRPESAPIRNPGKPPYLTLESFGNRPRLHVNLLYSYRPDPALNRNTHPLSMPDRKSCLEKGGGVLHSAPRDARVVEDNVLFVKSAIISPDRDSKPAISSTIFSTPIPRGKHGDRRTRDKPITRPYRTNWPRIPPGQKEDLENKFL
jgi:hypothetical protein